MFETSRKGELVAEEEGGGRGGEDRIMQHCPSVLRSVTSVSNVDPSFRVCKLINGYSMMR